jgi:tetratricopeptide (TPR) repeat protein
MAAGQFAEAERAFQQALDSQRRWAQEPVRPEEQAAKREMVREEEVTLLNFLGALCHEAGKLKEAEEVYRQAAALLLPDDGPTKRGGRIGFWIEPALTRRGLGDVLWDTGRPQAASAAYRDVLSYLETFRQRAEKHPPRGRIIRPWSELAWLLTTCPDGQLRDSARAAQLAREGMEWASQQFDKEAHTGFREILAVAQYQSGDAKAGLEVLESVTLRDPHSCALVFFEAMVRQKLGDGKRAAQAFDRGVEWMARNRPTDPELRRLRAEAAALVDVPQKKD